MKTIQSAVNEIRGMGWGEMTTSPRLPHGDNVQELNSEITRLLALVKELQLCLGCDDCATLDRDTGPGHAGEVICPRCHEILHRADKRI